MSNLVKCSDCSKKVSINADSCPNCGSILSQQIGFQDKKNKLIQKKVKEQKNQEINKTFLIWLLALVIMFLSLGVMTSSVFNGLMMLIGAILVLPPVKRFITKKYPVDRKALNWISFILIAAGFFIGTMEGNTEQVDNSSTEKVISTTDTEKKLSLETEDKNQLEPIAQESEAVEVLSSNWQYDNSEDEMRGETSYFASNESINTVELQFPYQGGTKLNILLRDNAKHGKDIMFIVNKGQIFCGYQDCHVNIKFDDGEVQRYETSEAEAGSSEVLFLTNNISGFVKKLKSSKTIMVEVNFYNHGAEQFKFDVSGLEWSRF